MVKTGTDTLLKTVHSVTMYQYQPTHKPILYISDFGFIEREFTFTILVAFML